MPAARQIHVFIAAALMLANWDAAAQSRPHVNSNAAVVHAMGDAHKGASLAVIAYEDALNGDAKFKRYKGIIEGNLKKAGFKIAADAKNSEFLAVISYGLEGRPPGGITVFAKSARLGGTAAASYELPRFGIPSRAEIGGDRSYKRRRIAMHIVAAKSLAGPRPQPILRVSLASEGICGVVSEVMDEMLLALFKEFPGTSGTSKFRTIYEAHYNC